MPTDLETILAAAVLAPSAHNTQPWKFKTAANQLDFFIDWSRHLTVSDPTGRELYVSLGCTIANAVVAARHLGLAPTVTFFPEGEGKDHPAARMVLAGRSAASGTDAADLYGAVNDRRTDRSLYDGQPLTSAERSRLVITDNVVLVEDRAIIAALAELTGESTGKTLSRSDFKAELSHWVRNSWTRQADGMPGYAMGIPAPVSLVAPLMVRLTPIHRQQRVETRQEMQSASVVAVITSAQDTPRDWLVAGQTLENLWLSATAAGLAAMPLVAAIEAGESTRTRLREIIGGTRLPQSLLRIGHSQREELKATPRRTVEDCLA